MNENRDRDNLAAEAGLGLIDGLTTFFRIQNEIKASNDAKEIERQKQDLQKAEQTIRENTLKLREQEATDRQEFEAWKMGEPERKKAAETEKRKQDGEDRKSWLEANQKRQERVQKQIEAEQAKENPDFGRIKELEGRLGQLELDEDLILQGGTPESRRFTPYTPPTPKAPRSRTAKETEREVLKEIYQEDVQRIEEQHAAAMEKLGENPDPEQVKQVDEARDRLLEKARKEYREQRLRWADVEEEEEKKGDEGLTDDEIKAYVSALDPKLFPAGQIAAIEAYMIAFRKQPPPNSLVPWKTGASGGDADIPAAHRALLEEKGLTEQDYGALRMWLREKGMSSRKLNEEMNWVLRAIPDNFDHENENAPDWLADKILTKFYSPRFQNYFGIARHLTRGIKSEAEKKAVWDDLDWEIQKAYAKHADGSYEQPTQDARDAMLLSAIQEIGYNRMATASEKNNYTAQQMAIIGLEEIRFHMDRLDKAGVDFGKLTGMMQDFAVGKLGIGDLELGQYSNELKIIAHAYRRAVTGLAASESELTEIRSMFAEYGKGYDIGNALTKGMINAFDKQLFTTFTGRFLGARSHWEAHFTPTEIQKAFRNESTRADFAELESASEARFKGVQKDWERQENLRQIARKYANLGLTDEQIRAILPKDQEANVAKFIAAVREVEKEDAR